MKNTKKKLILVIIAIILVLFAVLMITYINNSQIGKIASAEQSEKKAVITGTTDNRFTYIVNSDNTTISLEKYIGTDEDVIIPSTIDGYTVVGVSRWFLPIDIVVTNLTIPPTLVIGAEYGGEPGVCNSSTLKNVYLEGQNERYISKDGILFSKDGSELLIYPGGREDITYQIPSDVKTIGANAFRYSKNLISMVIPSTVTTIKKYAFAYCESLTSVTVPDSITYLDEGVFFCCYSLQSVKLPNSITSIGYECFFGCGSLEYIDIPNTVKEIDRDVFNGCSSLKEIIIPNGVTTIWKDTFQGCNDLVVTVPDSVTTIDKNAFASDDPRFGKIKILKCNMNSTAFEHALENNIDFILLDLESVRVKTPPTKTTYIQGIDTELDLTGGVLTLTVGSVTKDIPLTTQSVTSTGFNTDTLGTKQITIACSGHTTTLNVTVVEKTISRISIKTPPTKMNYVQDFEELDLTGGELTLTYIDNTTKDISMTSTGVTTSGFSNSAEGTVPVTITYGGKSTTLNVTIVAKTLSGISIKTNPTKINYIQSFENLDLTGGELKLIYNNNNSFTETISMTSTGVTTSGFSNSTVGTVPVTITYEGNSTTLNVTIVAKTLSGISVKTPPTKITYVQGFESLDLTGGELNLIYNNNDSYKETISMTSTGVTTSGFSNSTVGTVPVTITYGGKSTTLNVTIVAKTLSGISVKTPPTKMTYKQNIDSLDLTGGELNLIYNNNDSYKETISMTTTGVTTSGFSNSTVGTVPVTITYGGKSTTLNVTVIAKTLSEISVKTLPTKTSYKKDIENLDLTGGIITLKYDDNTTNDIGMTSSEVEVIGFSNTTLGKKELTVKYGNKTTTFEIEIICNINYEITPDGEGVIITGGDEGNSNIVIPPEINGKPVTDIGSGAFKDRDDLISVEIPDSVINIADDAFEGSEDTIIICNPGSKAEEFAKENDMSYIYKDKIITRIIVKTPPTKTSYKKDVENLDLTGGRLTVEYEEAGLTSVLRMTSKGITAAGFNNTEIGKKPITVSFEEKSATFEVIIEDTQSVLLGDIDGNGVVDPTDLLLMKRHIIAGTKTEWILTGDKFTRGDMDSNSIINPTDLLLLKRKIISR